MAPTRVSKVGSAPKRAEDGAEIRESASAKEKGGWRTTAAGHKKGRWCAREAKKRGPGHKTGP